MTAYSFLTTGRTIEEALAMLGIASVASQVPDAIIDQAVQQTMAMTGCWEGEAQETVIALIHQARIPADINEIDD
jgi:hypothetical protein